MLPYKTQRVYRLIEQSDHIPDTGKMVKAETVEEAAEADFKKTGIFHPGIAYHHKKAFNNGANWQKQQLQDKLKEIVVSERQRAIDIAADFMKSFLEKAKYKQPQSVQKISCEEQAEAARYIMNAIAERNGLNADKSLEEIIDWDKIIDKFLKYRNVI